MFSASDVRPVPSQRRGPLPTQLSSEACEPGVFLSETLSKLKQRGAGTSGKRLREGVKGKGKVRFPSANVFSPVKKKRKKKEQALEIKWSKSRARNCQGFASSWKSSRWTLITF